MADEHSHMSMVTVAIVAILVVIVLLIVFMPSDWIYRLRYMF